MLFCLVACLLACFAYKLLKYHRYWEEKGVPCLKTWPVLGEFATFIFRTTSLPDIILNIYKKIGDKRYSGIYQFLSPSLFLKDPDLIKDVTVKHFDHFVDHRTLISEEVDPFTARALIALTGERWHDTRAVLSPAFTSSKMKFMFSLVAACADQFVEHLRDRVGVKVEIKELFTRFTSDVIASCAFGLEYDSLKQQNCFYEMVKEASDISGVRGIKLFAYSLSPKLMTILRVRAFSVELLQFFRTIIRDAMKFRKEHEMLRRDMVHLLMEAKKDKLGKNLLTDDDMASQALLFVIAGFEAPSTVMAFAAYELALQPEIQVRLQAEIGETLAACGGRVTYDGLTKMKYMDMVISETLRKWPPLFLTDRKCVKDYTIEAKRPGESPIDLVKGDLVFLPIHAVQMDERYFSDPERFDPERFSDDNRRRIVPGTYIPFGIGPRNCIGSRFGLMECKAVIFAMLSKFDVAATGETEVPMELSKSHITIASKNGIWLALKQRSGK